MSDLRQAPEYARWMRAIGWQAENKLFIKKLPLVPWPFIKIQRQKTPIYFTAAKKYQAIQVKLEPAWEDKTDYLTLGFKPDKSPMLPTKTIWLDLTKSEAQLLKEMHYKTRYNIKKFSIFNFSTKGGSASGRQFSMTRGDKIAEKKIREFYEIYRQNCRRQRFWGLNFNQLKSLLKAFKLKSYLLMVENLGGLIILVHDNTAYYSHNGSTKQGRQKFVPTLLVWEAIKLAKKLGLKKFDFEGIDDKRWPGFSKFKRGFGGKEIEYRSSLSKYFLKEALWPKLRP